MKSYILTGIFTGLVLFGSAQDHGHQHGRKIVFPDLEDYKTLKCDLHIHTVFSDGNVWPTIRVEEALKDGLDAISLTEHLEYQPHKSDIPHPDRNRSFHIAKEFAKAYDLLIIHGCEITRRMPPGHANALFISDANKINVSDSLEAYLEANRQGAFVFWNHPNWSAQRKDGIAKLTDFHTYLIQNKLLHGIEVVNDITFSDAAIQIALDKNLTFIGNSDIHGLVDWQYQIPEGGHRPITLVFAKEKTEQAIKEALINRRTLAYYNDILVGEQQWIAALTKNSLNLSDAFYIGDTDIAEITVENKGDAPYILRNLSGFTFYDRSDLVILKPHEQTKIKVLTKQQLNTFELKCEMLNGVTAPNKHATIVIPVQIKR